MVDRTRRVPGIAEETRQPRNALVQRAGGWKCETIPVFTPNCPVKIAVCEGCVGMSDAKAW